MGKKSGILVSIDTGGKGMAYHGEQEQAFKDLKKHYIHYLDDSYNPIYVNGKAKKGLIDSSRLKLMGYVD